MKTTLSLMWVALNHFVLGSSFAASDSHVKGPREVVHASVTIAIDGQSSEQEWIHAKWHPLNIPIIGSLPAKHDFSGAYRMLWDEDYLYINIRFEDDVLYDSHPDPLNLYWDDDCVEIFLDEDGSGGDHLTNFNAFAYHVALDGNVVDIAPSIKPDTTHFVLLNDHVESDWSRMKNSPYSLNWELKVQVHNDRFTVSDNSIKSRVKLYPNKVLGFMLAYCDNDGSSERENFVGSHAIKGINGDKNLGYKNADVFGKIKLTKR